MANHHLIKVASVEYLDGYRLKVAFDDGAVKIIDFKNELWVELYEPLKDIEFFKRVSIDPDFKVLCWPNDADFANDTRYDMGVDVEQDYPARKPPVFGS